jgi:hypothetical protein
VKLRRYGLGDPRLGTANDHFPNIDRPSRLANVDSLKHR